MCKAIRSTTLPLLLSIFVLSFFTSEALCDVCEIVGDFEFSSPCDFSGSYASFPPEEVYLGTPVGGDAVYGRLERGQLTLTLSNVTTDATEFGFDPGTHPALRYPVVFKTKKGTKTLPATWIESGSPR